MSLRTGFLLLMLLLGWSGVSAQHLIILRNGTIKEVTGYVILGDGTTTYETYREKGVFQNTEIYMIKASNRASFFDYYGTPHDDKPFCPDPTLWNKKDVLVYGCDGGEFLAHKLDRRGDKFRYSVKTSLMKYEPREIDVDDVFMLRYKDGGAKVITPIPNKYEDDLKEWEKERSAATETTPAATVAEPVAPKPAKTKPAPQQPKPSGPRKSDIHKKNGLIIEDIIITRKENGRVYYKKDVNGAELYQRESEIEKITNK